MGAPPAYEALNRFFDRIFVITLPRATERQARVRERLAGLDFQFHLGADKLELDPARLAREGYDERAARRVSRLSRAMTPGQLGCALSHRQLYEETVRNGWRRVLVFEDDATPRLDDLPALPAALEQLPPDFDLVYLGYTNFERVTFGDRAKQAAYLALAAARLLKWTPGQVLRFHPRPYSPNLRRAGLHHCFHAYGFSAACARTFLEEQRPLAHVADQLPVHLILRGRLRAFVTEPKFFDQALGPSGADSFIAERRRA